MGGPDGKIFGSSSGRADRAQRGPCDLTESILSYDYFFLSFSFFGLTKPRAAALLRFESSDFLSAAFFRVGNCSISASESSPG